MSKGLEALKELRKQSEAHRWLEQQFEKEWLNAIENELKALEIVKKTFRLSFDDEELTIDIDNVYFLTFKNKEEYDLLKEVLS